MRAPAGRLGLSLAIGAALTPGLASCPATAAEVFDPDDAPETRYRVAPFLTLGAELEIDFEFLRNLDLDKRRKDDASLLTPELSVALSFDPAPEFQAFVSVTLSREFVLGAGAEGAGANEDIALEVKEAYVRVRGVPAGLSVQIGRQRFEDERQWLYDEELDAVRVRYERDALAVEASVSRNGLVAKDVFRDRPRRQINNYALVAGYRLLREIEVEGYAIIRDDQDDARQRPVFLGVRSRGEPFEDLDYWLELAHVGGRDGPGRIRAWAVDVGATYELEAGPRPSLTLGFAFGSGDRHPEDGSDGNFRQTGLQENEGDFGGAATFKYYGEVLDPELSNLAVFTVGLGIRPDDRFSLDVVYHHYVQHRASSSLRNAGIDAEPSGRSRRLGSEVDLVVGFEEIWNRIDGRVVLGHFMPAAAFPGSAGGAWLVGAQVDFRF
jgi:alginate production protein